ncbi:MAG TPA: hypothetical protein VKM94_11330 [Blastocatellia bacterium]|nr:hypothetical protein [Blastocatellia bacterium]
MKVVMVGGHSRNIGKTSVVEGIIRGTSHLNWTAVKITQFGHGVCSINGHSCGCAVDEHRYSISEERSATSGTDTARFLAAGAKRSLWVRTKQGELVTALVPFRQEIHDASFVIIETNSLRRFIKPSLYLQVIDLTNPDFKTSAQQFFDLADAYLLVDHQQQESEPAILPHAVLLAGQRRKDKPVFVVRPESEFMDSAVIEFVRTRIEDGS